MGRRYDGGIAPVNDPSVDDVPWPPDHVLAQLEALERRIAGDIVGHVLARRPDLDHVLPGWRSRHMRALQLLPPTGGTLTEVAAVLGMAKQSAAEIVAVLVEAGLVASEPHPDDRRAVVVRRTDTGRQLAADIHGAVLDMQDAWAAQVGPRRMATFLAVMRDLGVSA